MSIIPPTRLDIYLCSITITDFASIIICKKELNFTSTSTKLLKTPLYKGVYRGGGGSDYNEKSEFPIHQLQILIIQQLEEEP